MLNIIKLAKEFLDSEKLTGKLVGALVGGSYARGEVTPQSDIDILAIYKDGYYSQFSNIHSKEVLYKNYPISLILESKKDILHYLENPDPSIISFLKEGIIIYNPKGYLNKWIKRARTMKIFKNKEGKKESRRRLKERVAYNLKKIEAALAKKDTVLATYLLRGIVDEIVEKLRMYNEDWLYSQRKSHIKYLAKNRSKNHKIGRIFYSVNSPLGRNTIKKSLDLLKKYNI